MGVYVDIISGFLGSGKTTFIRKSMEEVFPDEKIALVENEFGEVGFDGAFLSGGSSFVTEITSGCICCTLALEFEKAIEQLARDPEVKRIIIEPSGVAKLSDVLRAVENVKDGKIDLGLVAAVVDVRTYEKFSVNFGPFFLDQIRNASSVVLSKTQLSSAEVTSAAVKAVEELNPRASVYKVPWDELDMGHLFSPYTGIREHEGGHHHGHHDEDPFETFLLPFEGVFEKRIVEERLGRLSQMRDLWETGGIIRVKGIFTDPREKGYRVDWVYGRAELSEVSVEGPGSLLFIGRNLPRNKIRELFRLP